MPIPIVDQLLSPPWIYIILPVIAGGIIYYLMKKYYWTGEEFVLEEFKDTIQEELDARFKTEGLRSKSRLMRGIDFLGNIDAWINVKGTHEIMSYDPTKKEYVKSKETPIPYNMYLLRKPPQTFFDKYIFREKNTYFLINKKQFDKFDPVTKSFNIKEDIQLFIFGNCFISSESGEEWITDISVKRANENTLTFLQNYSRKIIHLELTHAKTIDRYRTKTGLKKEQWESMKKEAEDVEENED